MLEKKKAGKPADIYGIGIILYELLMGISPFYSTELVEVSKKIKDFKIDFPNPISKEAKDLILSLMSKDPNKRLGAKKPEEITEHAFFKPLDWKKLLNKGYVLPVYNMSVLDDEFVMMQSMVALDDDDQGEDREVSPKAKVSNFSFSEDKMPV